MEEQWQVDRARLRRLGQENPGWSYRRLAQEIGSSERWVKKWLKRFKAADSSDETVLKSQSRRPKQAGSPVSAAVIERILSLRTIRPFTGSLARWPSNISCTSRPRQRF